MGSTTFPRRGLPPPPRIDELAARGLALRDAGEADAPFLQALYAGLRPDEMAFMAWPQALKDAFLADHFRLQHHHFVSHFSGADFWIVERSHRTGVKSTVGRFYLDRSASLWRVIDISLAPDARGQCLGSALLRWAEAGARDAGAAGIDLHAAVVNPAAGRSINASGFGRKARPRATTSAWHGGPVEPGPLLGRVRPQSTASSHPGYQVANPSLARLQRLLSLELAPPRISFAVKAGGSEPSGTQNIKERRQPSKAHRRRSHSHD
jgi:GNAT superfamily N-acetyltransferase